MTEPTAILRDEHILILRALDMVEAAAMLDAASDRVDRAWWTRMLTWLRGFADRNHHMKEENLLFPALEAAGIPNEGGPIGVMLREHTEGRALIAAIDGGPSRAASAMAYVGLLRAHISKENNVLFELAEAVLADATKASLAQEFEAAEAVLGRDASLREAAAELAAMESALGVMQRAGAV